jgi:hypothetical protein
MPFLIKYHIQRGKEGGIEKGLQHFMNGQALLQVFPSDETLVYSELWLNPGGQDERMHRITA